MRELSWYADQVENVYGIRCLPVAADWGKGIHDRIMFFDSRPLTLRVMARVHSTWFYDRDGKPQARINIGLTLPVDGDEEAVQQMYSRARPRSSE